MDLTDEISRRRTFAIISHPDAGKTTLTEKLLLYGGTIQTAGAVKSNKIRRGATSDFMEIERQRGISVSTSVMTFEYGGKLVTILDTPGHKDFAEDTYRTLTAVDSVILVVDSVKGVEEQTENLMRVCRMRKTPVIVFVNKLDREGQSAFELLDEIEKKLSILVRPFTWPIGRGSSFKGVYNLRERNLYLFTAGKTVVEQSRLRIDDLSDGVLDERLGSDANLLREEVALLDGVFGTFPLADYLSGDSAPVFFGSALNNFGVRELLETFLEIAPPPRPRETDTRLVEPDEEAFSGFVFKIHANIDPHHRDRIAFLRVCAGRFVRDRAVHHVRLDRQLRFSTPYAFMAQRKSILEEAFAGDVVGLYDRGNLKIGDTLTDGENLAFRGLPSFSPELFRSLVNADPMRSKQLDKGIKELTEEGVAQLFEQKYPRRLIVGTVGELQFEVIHYRLLHEYGASCRFERMPYARACWLVSDDRKALDRFLDLKSKDIAFDSDDNPVFMAESEWWLARMIEENPQIQFRFIAELNARRLADESLEPA